jgi:hypothetical protein
MNELTAGELWMELHSATNIIDKPLILTRLTHRTEWMHRPFSAGNASLQEDVHRHLKPDAVTASTRHVLA